MNSVCEGQKEGKKEHGESEEIKKFRKAGGKTKTHICN